ncbi:glycosyltransferase family 2 protein [Croceicoccus gelatinilyticus]|uniref:glycosyltransferase family 2 protein n=1 Tax=Croceicoccus gelatinilyticus TaxID=2835536 RepID=UPI001BD00DC8|nr:glycosyltransferase family 2 protein [Croceicoccus gelatinilyticus]MBS7670771.1 glycosyltransferase family 2 protein [Croceicoccus gelatinilyticus]
MNDHRKEIEGTGKIAVVVPCYKCSATIGDVVSSVPPEVSIIVLVDDRSDDGQSEVMAKLSESDNRISLVRNAQNLGVGGATVAGYRRAVELGATAIVKVDSDGQMDPAFAPLLARPVLEGRADYVKGNRFFDIESVRSMPLLRLMGNAGLTFFSRLSSGYWNISDPTNGFTAISADAVRILPLNKVNERYFFESDLLFRLNTFGALVIDQPMEAIYGDEKSNLSITHSMLTFPLLHLRNFTKRVVYNYILRNFDVASLSLLGGLLLLTFGLVFGIFEWVESSRTGMPATAGTVMLSVTPVLVGFQLLLSFLHYDISKNPNQTMNSRASSLTVLLKRDLKRPPKET